jgi:SMC interacting uncharacterized protein involved in chromosome segregation
MSDLTAREKHYQKLNLKLRQELNQLKTKNNIMSLDNNHLRDIIKILESNLKQIEEKYELLKNNQNLSEEEIQRLLKGSAALNMIVGIGKGLRY